MKQSTFTLVLLVAAFAGGIGIYQWMGAQEHGSVFHNMYEGGFLVAVLLSLLIMLPAYVIERIIALNSAEGKGGMTAFIRDIKQEIEAGRIDAAIEKCDAHGSSLSAVIRAGLEKYKTMSNRNLDIDKKRAEMQKAIEEATAMEMPLLERNLVAISTIASISTMVGLLGTTFGMIRSFSALANGGAPDAAMLSKGISEALYNTALGIGCGILAIVASNFFTTKIDQFTYQIDEAAYFVVQTLAETEKAPVSAR